MADSDISKLNHTFVSLKSGGEVIVLDTGAVIDAEAEAMLQALHSRSTGGLRAHLEVLARKGASNFMNSFYVGYGHKSIGDCGTTTLFVEGISMLAAKALQDFPLYSGQEASTRYIDFSKQPFIDPTNSEKGRELLERQRAFYLAARRPTVDLLKRIHPLSEGEDEKVYNKAIDARSFDITRCLLPAGAATNIAWHTNLRQAADRLLFLRHHPLPEVREIAEGIETALSTRYPNSFSHKRYDATEKYQNEIAAEYLFHDLNSPANPIVDFRNIDFAKLQEFGRLLANRPPKAEVPKYVSQAGSIDVKYSLDFGSFRDIQRHRAINQRMPLLTMDLGFHEWYIENLAPQVRDNLQRHLDGVRNSIEELNVSRETAQYFIPMGYLTANRFTGDIPSVTYMVELRDTRFVHPTLQRVAHSVAQEVIDNLKIPLHLDSNPGRFDIGRGNHDIVLK